MRAQPTSARALLAVACAALVAVLAPPVTGGGATAHAQAQVPRRMTLVSQSPYVGPGADLVFRLRVERSGLPAGSEVVVTVYRPVQTRSEFAQTLEDRIGRPAALEPHRVALAAVTPEANGDVTVRVPVGELGETNGVFPTRVDLRDPAGTLERITTHLVYLTSAHAGPKLGLAMVLPVHAPVSLPPDGQRRLAGFDDLVTSVAALEANRSLPYVVQATPETVAALAASTDDRADRVLESLRRLGIDHPVVTRPFVGVNVPDLVAAGLSNELGHQLIHGAEVLTDAFVQRPDTRTWVETGPLDPESVDELIRRGVAHFVVADSMLEPVPELNVTLSRPFVLGGREEDAPAVAADTDLSARFNAERDQVLEAHHLLADLAVLWLDAPADRRAVVAVAPPGWKATRAFLDVLTAGLTQNPVMEAVAVETVFTAVTPALAGRGLGLVRHPAPASPGALDEVAPAIRQARGRLASLATVLSPAPPSMALLQERLLAAQSAELGDSRARQAYVDAVETGIADQLGAIEMPTGRSITLTARQAQIPVTFQNRTGSPVKVLVTVQSDKLEFPDGSTRSLDLERRNTTERFEVLARTSGAFPLRITLQSPDGNLLIGQARLTVRSTAASSVSLVVSAGALFFLAVWWARHVVRGRRAARLVPA
ncbi:MAG: DUF6049 family protein [Actinomycetota bacterium]